MRLSNDMISARWPSTVMGLALALAACSDVTPPIQPPQRTLSFLAAHTTPGPKSRGFEDVVLKLEEQFPGFGGLFLNRDGDVEFFVKDSARLDASIAGVHAWLATNTDVFRRSHLARLIPRQGAFAFSDLVEWHNRLRRGALAADDIAFIDADESTNRLRVIVRTPEALAGLDGIAQRLGIPRDAIAAEIGDFVVTQTADSVRSTLRPTKGGIQISFPDSNAVVPGNIANLICTLGFNVTVGGTDYALTASHCEKQFIGTLGRAWYQAWNPSLLGTTAINPAWPTVGCVAGASSCRETDAMLVQYAAGVTHDKKIVETSVIGNTTTAGNRIIGATYDVYVPQTPRMPGDSLYKTGAISGTTRGIVGGSCGTTPPIFPYSQSVNCTSWASPFNEAGDSGGAVYYFRIPLNLNVRIPEGITWGRGNVNGVPFMLYNTWDQIQTELGVTMIPY